MGGAASQSSQFGGFRPKVQIGSGKQSAELKTVGQSWTDIPGTKVDFTLTSAMTVHMSARGSVGVAAGSVSGSTPHCGLRFVVDGTPYGNATWGDVIVSIASWSSWSMERHLLLVPGAHTVKIQQSGYSGTDTGCHSYAEEYSAARLNIEAY